MKALLMRLIRSKLLTQSGFYLAGQLLQKATSFLLVPIWTLYLMPADYGIVGTMAAYSTLLHIVLMLGIYSAVVRYLYEEHDQAERKTYIFSNFIFLCLFSGLVLVGLYFLKNLWWSKISSGGIPFDPFVTLTLVSVWAGFISRFVLFVYQAQQRALAYIILEAAGFILSVGFGLFFVVHYKMGAYGQILGGFIGQAVVTAIALVIVFQDWFSPHLALKPVWDALKFGLPLVPHLLSGWALTFVDRIMLEHFVPLSDVGYYNLGYNLGMGMLVLVTSINQAYQPHYYDLMRSGREPEKRIIRITSLSIAGLGVITLFGSLFAGELITVLTPPKYQNAAIFVPPILLSYLFVGFYFFVGSPLFYFKKTGLLPLITGSAAVLNVLLNLLLIPRYGAIAAAWSTLISYGAMLLFYYIIAQNIHRLPYPIGRYGALIAILVSAVVLTQPAFDASGERVLVKLSICGAFAALAFVMLVRPHMRVSALVTRL